MPTRSDGDSGAEAAHWGGRRRGVGVDRVEERVQEAVDNDCVFRLEEGEEELTFRRS